MFHNEYFSYCPILFDHLFGSSKNLSKRSSLIELNSRKFLINLIGTRIGHKNKNKTPKIASLKFLKQSNNKSGYKGVYKHSQYDKWVAQIKVGDTRKHIGVFNTPEAAAKVYDIHAEKYHGIYAWKNLK